MAHTFTHIAKWGVLRVWSRGTALGAGGEGAGVAVVQCAVCLLPRHALGKWKVEFLIDFLATVFLGVGRRKQKQGTGSPEVSQVPGVLRQVCGERRGLEFMTPIIYEFQICLARCHSAGQTR